MTRTACRFAGPILTVVLASAVTILGGNLETDLANACVGGDFGHAMALINEMADVNGATVTGSTPLIETCRAAQFTGVMFLATHGADVNLAASDSVGTTPLIAAVEGGDSRVVRFLLGSGAKVGGADRQGRTALLTAASRGETELVDILIEQGADVEGRAEETRKQVKKGTKKRAAVPRATALMLAVEQGHTSVAELLVSKGANVNAADSIGTTPLMFACLLGDQQLVKVLIQSGADINARDKMDRSAVDYALTLASPAIAVFLAERGVPSMAGYSYQRCRGLYRCSRPAASLGTMPHYIWFLADGTVYSISSDIDSSQLANIFYDINPDLVQGSWAERNSYLQFSLKPRHGGNFFFTSCIRTGDLVAGTANDGVLELDVRSSSDWKTFALTYTAVNIDLFCRKADQ